MKTPEVIFLDVGGVLLLPAADRIATGLMEWGATPVGHDDARVHYAAVAAFDLTGRLHDYRRRYAEMVGVPPSASGAAARSAAFEGPWRQVVPGSVEALRQLASEFAIVIVSDSDGTVCEQLRHAGLAQVGPGEGVEVLAILDSTNLGERKPHPRIFQRALQLLDAAPEQTVMIGDSVRCDVHGAAGLGIRSLHVTPSGGSLCGDHDDVTDIAAAAALLTWHVHA